MNEYQRVVFAGQTAGITEFSDKFWLVSLVQYDIGFIDKVGGCPLGELCSTILTEYCLVKNKHGQLL